MVQMSTTYRKIRYVQKLKPVSARLTKMLAIKVLQECVISDTTITVWSQNFLLRKKLACMMHVKLVGLSKSRFGIFFIALGGFIRAMFSATVCNVFAVYLSCRISFFWDAGKRDLYLQWYSQSNLTAEHWETLALHSC